MAVIGYIGRNGSGKTYLAQHHARAYWERFRYLSLVLDINRDQHAGWGRSAYATADRDDWLARVRDDRTRNVMVFCDDATMTVARAPELLDLFTRLSRRGKRLHVLGHGNGNFLPMMREQFSELFLFRVSQKEADEWAQLFADDSIRRLAPMLDLKRFQHVHAVMGEPARVEQLAPD